MEVLFGRKHDKETRFIVTLPNKEEGEKEDEIHSYSGRPSRGRTRRFKIRQLKAEGQEIWDSLEQIIHICEMEEIDRNC